MEYLPLFFDLKNQSCLIVGGGSIAVRKARLLAKAGGIITVVAPEICDELQGIASETYRRNYQTEDVESKILVISATDLRHVNEQVAGDCKQRGIPVNVVDSPDLCTVITPAIVDRSPLVIGISSGGESPVVARKVRTLIESSVAANYGDLARFGRQWRDRVKEAFEDVELRRRFWEMVFDGDIAENVLSGDLTLANSKMAAFVQQKRCENGGEVYLVGAGPGDPDLLTFKALRLMQKAEVVLYDRLVSEPILEMVRRDAERIYVGKKRSHHTLEQPQINQMILSLAQEGKRVLRLKGGDPFIFGRGGEEIELLAKYNIPFQVVPGITAASGCASYAGIPLTHRDYSQSVRFITGHSKPGGAELVWKELVDDHQTLVFYMGLSNIKPICENLIASGKDPQTPAALVERGTLPEQKVHESTITDLPSRVANTEIHAPTLLIIGNIVKLRSVLQQKGEGISK